MKGLAILLAAICCVLTLIIITGMFLPKRHVVSLSATYAMSPEALSALIRGPQSWRPEVAQESLEFDSAGRTLSLETDKRGRTVVYEIRVLKPSREFSRHIVNSDLPYGGTWTYVLEPIGAKTKLTITEDGEVYNAALRFVAHFIVGYEGSIRNYLVALGQIGGEKVTPSLERRR